MAQQRQIYDCLVVLAQRQVGRWGLPSDLKKRLDEAARLFKAGNAKHVVLCGRWAIHYDLMGILPPITESQRMKQYLVRRGIPPRVILMEQHSKDTIGNAYYLKALARHHPELRSFLVVCGKPHVPRVQFIFDRIFGDSYRIDYHGVATDHFPNSPAKERTLLAKTQAYLKDIPPGHDEALRGLLYRSGWRRRMLQIEQSAKKAKADRG